MGMQIMQLQLIEQSLFDDFMCQKEGFDTYIPPLPIEGAREMTVDEDRLAIDAIARDVGNIILAVRDSHTATDCANRVQQNIGRDVTGSVPDFSILCSRQCIPPLRILVVISACLLQGRTSKGRRTANSDSIDMDVFGLKGTESEIDHCGSKLSAVLVLR